MQNEYDNVVKDWFEELKLPFINYIRANFKLRYDVVVDIYSETWLDVRKIIFHRRATDIKWRALIFKIGWRKAYKITQRIPAHVSINADESTPFNQALFEAEKAAQMADVKSVYEDPDLQEVLGAELSYLPNPCNRILKLFYYDGMSMTEIAQTMNYGSPRSAITTKNRCMDKLKLRVKRSARLLGIIN